MPSQSVNQTQQQTSTTHPLSTGSILQRQCITCGQHTIAGDTCPECEKQQSLFERSPGTAPTIAIPPVPPTPTGGFNHDISRVPVRRSSLPFPIQAKLTVGEPGDKYEQEADQVADQVMRMPDLALSGGKALTQPSSPLTIQRITPVNGENLRRQYEVKEEDEDEEKKSIQAKEMTASSLQLLNAAPAQMLQRQPMEVKKDEEDEEEKTGGTVQTKALLGFSIQTVTSMAEGTLQRQDEENAEEQLREEEEEEEKPLQGKEMAGSSLQLLSTAPAERLQRQPMEIDKDEEDEEEKTGGTVQAKALPGFSIEPVNSMAEGTLQRQGEEDVEEQKEKEEEEEENQQVQAKEHPGQTPKVTPTLEARLNRSQGQGKPLPEETREFMESRFGRDFSQVRVHPDAEAAQMSQELKAQAFTHRQDMFFGVGKYSPETREAEGVTRCLKLLIDKGFSF